MKLSDAQQKVLDLLDDGYAINGAWIGLYKHGAAATKDTHKVPLKQTTLDKLTGLGLLTPTRNREQTLYTQTKNG